MLRHLGLLSVLLVAACAGGVPIDRQVVVSGSRYEAVRGEAALTVRTFLEDNRSEVVGATCEVVSSLYAATLVTPSRLVVPNFGPQSPELTATCRADQLSGSRTVDIITRWQPLPGAWGYPYGPYSPYGPWGWGWYGPDYGPGYPVSDYPDLRVILR
jgi:hypothetical protein